MKIKIRDARQSFSSLWTAVAFSKDDGEDKKKFKNTFLIPKGSQMAQTVEAAILAKATEKWGAKAQSTLNSIRGNANRFAWQDGDTKDWDGYPGHMALTAKSISRPLVIGPNAITSDAQREPGREYTEKNSRGQMFPILTPKDGTPYDGCFVHGTVEVFCYDEPSAGVSFGLKAVQYAKAGDAFGGGTPANPDDFDDLGVPQEEEAESLAG